MVISAVSGTTSCFLSPSVEPDTNEEMSTPSREQLSLHKGKEADYSRKTENERSDPRDAARQCSGRRRVKWKNSEQRVSKYRAQRGRALIRVEAEETQD